ncbi:MAG: hypothetical protein JWQ28_663 [Pedobacter sp.]|jgi:hypothetical protein|nr:hypothetical protein [Pedobacter sp.]
MHLEPGSQIAKDSDNINMVSDMFVHFSRIFKRHIGQNSSFYKKNVPKGKKDTSS